MWWPSKKNQSSILAAVGFIAGVLVIILGFKIYWLSPNRGQEKERIDPATYQAIFLDNNQIYFGKLKDVESRYPILEEVYYVRLEGENATSGRLVRLGETEPHGPKPEMILNRDHILFWENLRPDSQIIQTIRSLKSNQ